VLGYLFMPAWTLGTGMRQEALWYQTLILGLPWFGLIFLLAGSALMPAIVERIALGRIIWVLPGGRAKLLAGTVIPALLLAVVTAVAATISFLNYPISIDYGEVLYRTFFMAFVDFGLIFAAIWLVGKTSGVWRLLGLLWIIVSITIPTRYLAGIPPFSPLEGLGLAAWALFGAMLLAGGRARHALERLRASVVTLAGRASRPLRYVAGSETDLLLDTTRPWIIALSQVIPIGIMAWFVAETRIWIVFLMIFSAIAGAITSQAAARSRRLWLRFNGSREQLFPRVEWAYWRYNACSLGVLLVLYLVLGRYFEFNGSVLVLGVALLAVGCTVFHYLGLMITRGLGWFESTLCILTMSSLTLAAVAIMRQNVTVAVELELLLVVLAVVYRFLAQARWAALDWMRSS
jgi:hypothetical protein